MFVCASILAEQASASQTNQCDWCYLLAHSDFDDWNDFLGDQTLHPQKCLPVLVLVLVVLMTTSRILMIWLETSLFSDFVPRAHHKVPVID